MNTFIILNFSVIYSKFPLISNITPVFCKFSRIFAKFVKSTSFWALQGLVVRMLVKNAFSCPRAFHLMTPYNFLRSLFLKTKKFSISIQSPQYVASQQSQSISTLATWAGISFLSRFPLFWFRNDNLMLPVVGVDLIHRNIILCICFNQSIHYSRW